MKPKAKFLFLTGSLLAFFFANSFLSAQGDNPPSISNLEMSAVSLGDEQMLQLAETFGHFIGRNLNAPGISLDVDSVIKGIRNAANGKPAPLTDQEFEQMMALLQAQAFTKIADDNLVEANAFLKLNQSQEGVIEIEPVKLQFKILKEGSGDTVAQDHSPLIHYKGSFIDGTQFGSSEDTGGPITVPLSQTIPGFSKGIVGMKEGETRQLFVHPDFGYGTSGALQPNAMLIFEIEVIKANNEQDETADEE